MLDVIGFIALIALAILVPTVLIMRTPAEAASRRRLGWILFTWLALLIGLGSTGFFSSTAAGTPAIGIAVVAPLLIFLIAFRRSDFLRAVAFRVPLSLLVGIHAGRLLGVFFLILYAAGRLPATFAMAAGWGDIGVASVAAALALAIHRGASNARAFVLLWNMIGFADLLLAVVLGIGSAPDSPLRFIFETANTGTMGSLPWLLIPGFLVPVYLLTHLAIFARLAYRSAIQTSGSQNATA